MDKEVIDLTNVIAIKENGVFNFVARCKATLDEAFMEVRQYLRDNNIKGKHSFIYNRAEVMVHMFSTRFDVVCDYYKFKHEEFFEDFELKKQYYLGSIDTQVKEQNNTDENSL